MADFFLDISALGNEYQAYAATPTWGALSTDKPLPMDGNGKAGPSHAAAVAIAELQITVLPADGNTIAVAGATLTAKTTAAAKNQWTIGGSIATCITNLVALLNTFGTGTAQCDAAVSTSASQIALAVPYFQFSRIKPGTTDTIQLATRIAGANLNHATNSAVAIASAGWSTPPTITQFAGGADGPFAYLWNTVGAVFGKTGGDNANPGYGVACALPGGPTNPTFNDPIFTRCARSGSSLTLTHNNTPAATGSSVFNLGVLSTVQRTVIFDSNGTTWSGDSGQLYLSVVCTNVSSGYHFQLTCTNSFRLIARTTDGFRIRQKGTGGAGFTGLQIIRNNSAVAGCQFVLERIYLEEDPDSSNNGAGISINPVNANFHMSVNECHLFCKSSRLLFHGGAGGLGGSMDATYTNTLFEFAQSVSGLANLSSFSGFTSFRLRGCTFVDRNNIANPVVTSLCTGTHPTNTSAYFQIEVDQCTGVAPFVDGQSAVPYATHRTTWSKQGPDKEFRITTGREIVEWIAGNNIPTLDCLTLSGTAWAIKWMIREIGDYAGAGNAAPRISTFHRAADSVRTVKMELLLPDAATFSKANLFALVSYISPDGVVHTESTKLPDSANFDGSSTAPAASAASWSMNGTSSYSAKKLELTTAYQIKTNTEVMAQLCYAGRPPGSVDRTMFYNPTLVLT